MTCQNLAVCFGPVLLGQKQETSQQGARTFSHSKELASALDFKRHIEVLHYLLQMWPSDRIKVKRDAVVDQTEPANCLRPSRQPPPLTLASEEVVCRNRAGRVASSSRNRHAGDWSGCGRSYLAPGGDRDGADCGQFPALGIELAQAKDYILDAQEPADGQDGGSYPGGGELDFESDITGRTKDFDSLIADIERELAKKIIFL
ncbi:rho GTPase-activating protein SYDE1-like [Heptranchias perlo]|uniref:rho GTPase-activating protein SYDE1-like n=1 Tax=Heptranchias perlo TaxID=212740 RepID=UPI0035593C7B